MNLSAQRYPIGIQTFSKVREKGLLYVDKTEYVHRLIGYGQYVFLSRPRRFGKSLLLSTIEAFYRAKKELFEGLDIAKYEHDWLPREVLHLDFTGMNYSNPDSLRDILVSTLDGWERKYGVVPTSQSPDLRFGEVIKAAFDYAKRKVVILVDEYDKPLQDTAENEKLQTQFRSELRGVYGNLKKMDAFIEFAMLTGVTKMGKLSIFSDLNNLKDISMTEEFSGICGITENELHHYLGPGVEEFARENNMSVGEAFETLKRNYDGYHFAPKTKLDIYNPFSMMNALQDREINYYWFETGTPYYLVKQIKKREIPLHTFESVKESRDSVMNVSFDLKTTLIPVLYQSGYLTIKGYDAVTRILTLGFPNLEVRRGFLLELMSVYTNKSENSTWADIVGFYEDVIDGKVDDFMQRLQSLYSDFNRDGFTFIDLEQHYQDIAYLVFKLLGCITHTEYRTAKGRIDMTVETSQRIFVFEFKLDGTAREAMEQIENRGYLLPFKADGRELVKIGASFSSETHSLKDWIIEY